MKLLAIAIVCLSLVLAEESKESLSTNDQLDVLDLAENEGETKSSEAQRKRDSGYSYSRPDRFSSHRYESSGTRGRIVTKYPSSQTIRPFNRYGPPKQSAGQFGKPSSQYAPQHQYSGPYNRHPQSGSFGNQNNQFSDGQSGGQTQQEVPSPIRTYDFVTPSPIASQNNEPFNSNAAGYLPPRNQKLPGYSNSQTFSHQNQQKNNQPIEDHRITNNQPQQQQNFNNNFQSQSLLQSPFPDQAQISDAALFLSQNAQAISQLYETPAANLNYEPIQNFQGPNQLQNPNSQFQTFDVNTGSQGQSSEFVDSRNFRGSLPSYASGILDSQEALQRIQSLEKDRLINQLQQALVTAQGKAENVATTSARYALNHPPGSYAQNQALLASLGTQINPSIGPQLDKPNGFNQRPFGSSDNKAFGQSHYLPGSGTTSALPFTYGLPSTTPATQAPSTSTTTATSTTTSTSQRPQQGVTGDGSSQVGTSVSPPATSATYPFPQYGGFVPTLIGTNLVNYPTYGTNFVGSSGTVNPVQSAGSSPTHFGIPIPTSPDGSQATNGSPSTKPPFPQKPQSSNGHQNPQSSIPVHTIPLQPIQPIHPIASTPVQSIYPIPSVSQVHPVQGTLPVASGHPTYGVQTAVVNPLLLKPVKAVYPVYYYPNVYQIQKPVLPSHPWSYAPSYAQAKPTQIWK